MEAKLRDHQEEPVDPRWARVAQEGLSGSLDQVAGDNFETLAIDCKTTTCVATVEWPDRKTAQQTYRSLLHASLEPNCSVSVFLAEGGGGDRNQSKVFFDCEESRTQ